ncbi:hypothetical protein K502DRAFT_334134 [Neoconidiobolus thromboides FSU 785]|nr:hypothetical protein K502DRAFT_334134 [Neoconidiobolus thromboides FSU 785]
MSRHRDVRNLDIDEILEEDDYYDEEVPALSAEDEGKMRLGVESVYTILGEDVELNRDIIEETLWYYYFDIEASVDYLLKEISNKKKQDKKKENKEQKSSKNKVSQLEMDLSAMNLDTSEIKRPVSPPVINKKINVINEFKKRDIQKPNINLVIVGHVDSGKSTLMGHILYQVGKVDERTMKKYPFCKKSFAYAWVLDETSEERERGVTVDIATSEFTTENRHFTILDAPGHQDFIPNMISGAAQADAAILVINSSQGEFETGFSKGGQTKEHALLIRSLGVKQVVIAVNKLDMCDWDEGRYQDIVAKLMEFMTQAGFNPKSLTFIPISGLKGDNLVNSIKNRQHPLNLWYKGPPLLDVIDKFQPPSRPIELPLRIPVADFFKGGLGSSSGVTVSGRIVQGNVQIGDILYALPGDEKGVVKVIEINDNPVPWAVAGDSVSVTLGNIDLVQFRSGTVLCPQDSIISTTNVFLAQILTFDTNVPITNGYPIIIHYQSLNISGYITKLVNLLDKSTGEIIKNNPRHLPRNSTATVQIKTDTVLAIEPFNQCKELGRIALRNSGNTIATGIVLKVLPQII